MCTLQLTILSAIEIRLNFFNCLAFEFENAWRSTRLYTPFPDIFFLRSSDVCLFSIVVRCVCDAGRREKAVPTPESRATEPLSDGRQEDGTAGRGRGPRATRLHGRGRPAPRRRRRRRRRERRRRRVLLRQHREQPGHERGQLPAAAARRLRFHRSVATRLVVAADYRLTRVTHKCITRIAPGEGGHLPFSSSASPSQPS